MQNESGDGLACIILVLYYLGSTVEGQQTSQSGVTETSESVFFEVIFQDYHAKKCLFTSYILIRVSIYWNNVKIIVVLQCPIVTLVPQPTAFWLISTLLPWYCSKNISTTTTEAKDNRCLSPLEAVDIADPAFLPETPSLFSSKAHTIPDFLLEFSH